MMTNHESLVIVMNANSTNRIVACGLPEGIAALRRDPSVDLVLYGDRITYKRPRRRLLEVLCMYLTREPEMMMRASSDCQWPPPRCRPCRVISTTRVTVSAAAATPAACARVGGAVP
jgi:hypothetical protein